MFDRATQFFFTYILQEEPINYPQENKKIMYKKKLSTTQRNVNYLCKKYQQNSAITFRPIFSLNLLKVNSQNDLFRFLLTHQPFYLPTNLLKRMTDYSKHVVDKFTLNS